MMRLLIKYIYLPLIVVRNFYIQRFKKEEDPEVYGLMFFILTLNFLVIGSFSILRFSINKYIYGSGFLLLSFLLHRHFSMFYKEYLPHKKIPVSRIDLFFFLIYIIFAVITFVIGINKGFSIWR